MDSIILIFVYFVLFSVFVERPLYPHWDFLKWCGFSNSLFSECTCSLYPYVRYGEYLL
uniref:Uncharacterized protein n=1 Tax=Anguilla anguilla TaxID=7936 RepID=A0A0E9WRW5_ANGAN